MSSGIIKLQLKFVDAPKILSTNIDANVMFEWCVFIQPQMIKTFLNCKEGFVGLIMSFQRAKRCRWCRDSYHFLQNSNHEQRRHHNFGHVYCLIL